jgi:hypothetical protein
MAARTTTIAITIGSVEEEPPSLCVEFCVPIGLAVDCPPPDEPWFEPLSWLLCGLPSPLPLPPLGVPPEPEEFSVSEVSSGVSASEPVFEVLVVEGVDECLFDDVFAGGLVFGGPDAEGGVSEYWISPESA